MKRGGIVVAVLLAALTVLSCGDLARTGDATSTPGPKPAANSPAAPGTANPAPAPNAGDVGAAMPPKSQLEFLGESKVVVDVADPTGKPPAEPDEVWIDTFLRRMHEALNDRDARFLLSRFSGDVKLEFTLGERKMTMASRDWYVRAMTGMQGVEKYRWTVEERNFTIAGKTVTLRLRIVEEYERDGRTVRGKTFQTMDLVWQPDTGDFVIRSMIAESSGIPEFDSGPTADRP
jgi:hypothetical protein